MASMASMSISWVTSLDGANLSGVAEDLFPTEVDSSSSTLTGMLIRSIFGGAALLVGDGGGIVFPGDGLFGAMGALFGAKSSRGGKSSGKNAGARWGWRAGGLPTFLVIGGGGNVTFLLGGGGGGMLLTRLGGGAAFDFLTSSRLSM